MDLSVKTRVHLSKKAVRAAKEDLVAAFGDAASALFDNAGTIEEGKLSTGGTIMFLDREPAFFKLAKDDVAWVPFLHQARRLAMKRVVVDQPGVPYIAGGADVMRPGVVHVDPVVEGEIVAVVDEKNHAPVAIGRAMFDTRTILAMEKGKVVKTIHHPGDKIWALK